MRETNILLVRHPETEGNVDGRLMGRNTSPFTTRGYLQARRLPKKIAAFQPDAIWSSPLERAHVVATRAARITRTPLTVDDRLIELDFGEAEGMTFEEIAEAGLSFNFRSRELPVAPGGESRQQIEERAAEVCDELVATGGRFAVITHGGVVRASIMHLLGLPSDAIWAFHVHNAQMAHVRIVEGHGSLEEYVEG